MLSNYYNEEQIRDDFIIKCKKSTFSRFTHIYSLVVGLHGKISRCKFCEKLL